MAEQHKSSKKNQISIDEYAKLKERQAKSKLKLHFPLFVKWLIAIPFIFFTLMVLFFMFYLRFLPEH